MKTLNILIFALLAAISGLPAATAATADSPVSLRGMNPPDQQSDMPELKQWRSERAPIPRDYVMQPPLIPHSIEGYDINRKFNKCLTCHSWANYHQSGATKISQTHFEDRDSHVLANVSARRYFCTQCHVSQMDARPLVGNTFEPVKMLQDVR